MSIKMALAQPEMTKLQNKYALKKDPASQQKNANGDDGNI